MSFRGQLGQGYHKVAFHAQASSEKLPKTLSGSFSKKAGTTPLSKERPSCDKHQLIHDNAGKYSTAHGELSRSRENGESCITREPRIRVAD